MTVHVDQRIGTAVRVQKITRTYRGGSEVVTALAGVDATFGSGTFTAVMGPSGSGKSTLLQCAAGLDRPDEVERIGLTGRLHHRPAQLSGGQQQRVAASYADRVMVLADGRIVSDTPQPGAARIAEQLAALDRRGGNR